MVPLSSSTASRPAQAGRSARDGFLLFTLQGLALFQRSLGLVGADLHRRGGAAVGAEDAALARQRGQVAPDGGF
ncbi:hypothetical protein AWV80_10715 [Cupriavidus sp. UYMU48A]|nr:hypothetical protein AWV80_10715 [Cupriavidus sp. UYMU48A]